MVKTGHMQKVFGFINKLCGYLIVFVVASSCLAQSSSAPLQIVTDGRSAYTIAIPPKASIIEKRAAEVMADYIERVSGVKMKIIPQTPALNATSTIIWLKQQPTDRSLEQDGFNIRTDNKNLIIEGGSRKGLLYGVYTFLEDYMGCRLFAADVYSTPSQKTIIVPGKLNIHQTPVFQYRSTFFRELTANTEYPDWHKLYNIFDFKKRDYSFEDWGMFVHTFDKLVPPTSYLASHPEYYSLVKGKRIPSQLCLTNPQVLNIAINTLKAEIKKDPRVKYWSVSQNDNFDYCQCPNCSKVYQEEGGPQGTIIRFVNKVAEQFPTKTISTLAYQYSRAAPKKTRPNKNVNIMLCYQVDRVGDITKDPDSKEFIGDLNNWLKLTKNIFIWDYVVQFTNLLSPYPNLYLLQPNIRYFRDRGIKMMFQQGWDKGELSELRCYLTAKLLWNPDLNVDQTIDEFLKGYYQGAAPFIKQYIVMLENERKTSGKKLEMFGNMTNYSNYFITRETLPKAKTLFDQAEDKVKNDNATLQRVKVARLPIQFMEIELIKKDIVLGGGAAKSTRQLTNNKSELEDKLSKFISDCKKGKVTSLSLTDKTIDQFAQETRKIIQ